MEFKEKSRNIQVVTNGSNGDINYEVNYTSDVTNGKLTSLSGIVSKTSGNDEVNLGSFSVNLISYSVDMANNPTINFNLNEKCVISDKQKVLVDIYAIIDLFTPNV